MTFGVEGLRRPVDRRQGLVGEPSPDGILAVLLRLGNFDSPLVMVSPRFSVSRPASLTVNRGGTSGDGSQNDSRTPV